MNLPVKDKFSQESKKIRRYSFEEKYNLVYLTVILFFVGNTLAAVYGFQTIISIMEYSQIAVLMIVISFLIQNYFFKSIFEMKKMEYLMVSVFGAGPMLTAIVLILNYYIHLDKKVQTYVIDEIAYEGPYQRFLAEGLPCDKHPDLCKIHSSDLDLNVGMKVEVTLGEGLFGFWVIDEMKETDNN